MASTVTPQDIRNRKIGRWTAILLGLTVLSSVLVSGSVLTRNHGWGDDFAAYVMQAQSIVSGKMDEFVKRNSLTIEYSDGDVGPITAPWGFPLLLSPFYAVFGPNVLALKLVGTLCYACFLVVFLFLARRRLTGTESLLLTAVLAYNPVLLDAQNGILMDVPFMLFSTLALLLMLPLEDEAQGGGLRPALVGLAIFAAAFTRLNGLLLFLPLLLIHVRLLRIAAADKVRLGAFPRDIGVPYAVFALCYMAQMLVFPSVNLPLNRMLGEDWSGGLLGNLGYYLRLPVELFEFAGRVDTIIYAVLAAFFLVSLAAHWRRDAPVHVYLLATLALYASYPSLQGLRYIFPILPLFLLLTCDGMSVVRRSFPALGRPRAAILFGTLWLGLAAFSLGASVQAAWDNLANGRTGPGGAAEAFSPDSTRMFEFIESNTPPSSVVIFFKPRAMHLIADRDSFRTGDCRELKHGDYVVIIKDPTARYQVPADEAQTCNPALRLMPVYDSNSFITYQIASLR